MDSSKTFASSSGNEIPYLSNKLPLQHRSENKILNEALKSKKSNSKKEQNKLEKETPPELTAPRQYQIELLNRALSRNTIAVLETGAGKTLVAVMLIKEIIAQHFKQRQKNPKIPRRIVVFLVNLVPLVFQQGAVIKVNTPHRVELVCGEMKVDIWKLEEWRQRVDECEVLVLTAQIFVNMLRHAVISIEEVELLIFDECHHTQKRHPYNQIMEGHYHTLKEGQHRPKIFGMTASPLGGRSGAIAAAESLEKALDAHIYTIGTTDELRNFVQRPKEISVTYKPPPNSYRLSPLITHIQSQCSSNKALQSLCEASAVIMRQLGPWPALLFFTCTLDEYAQNEEIFDTSLLSDNFTPNQLTMNRRYLQRALEIYREYQLQINVDPLNVDPMMLNESMISPKAKALLITLDKARAVSELCGIVFVRERCVAVALRQLVQKTPALSYIKSSCLLGHGGSGSIANMCMNFTQQNRTIRNFKARKINLLIATDVAEEGLDIQPCNLVLRFDFFTNLISYIQSRGRARQKNSVYIILQEAGNESEDSLLKQLQVAEREMMNWCQALPDDRFRVFSGRELEEDADSQGVVYKVDSTGATMTLESSVELLNQVCDLLPQDEYCQLRPQVDINREGSLFQCTLTLPPNCPIKIFRGDLARSKARAYQSCTFQICVKLHKAGLLNDNLLPIREEVDPDDHDPTRTYNKDGFVEGSWLAQHTYYAKNPDFWQLQGDWEDVYLNIIRVDSINDHHGPDSYQPLALVTRRPLPKLNPVEMFFKGTSLPVSIVSAVHPSRSASQAQLIALHQFTLTAFCVLFRKEFICDFKAIGYLLAPLLVTSLGHVIDWGAVKSAITPQLQLDLSKDNLVVCDVSDNNCRYFVKKIHHDLNPLSKIPQTSKIQLTSPPICFADDYRDRLKKTVTDLNQPVLEVQRVAITYNFLQKSIPSVKKKGGRRAEYLLPEFCKPYMLSAPLLRSLMIIPSLMIRIDGLLLIHEVKARLQLPNIRDELLLEAFTLSTANLAMDYERLELLGDSFLKFIATLDLYIRFPRKHEGQLHCQRVRIIGNRTMYFAAKERELPLYFITRPFNRKVWRPPNTLFSGENKPPEPYSRQLSDKALADVVEATLGAALLSSGESCALSTAKALGIPLGDIYCWDDIRKHAHEPRINLMAEHSLDVGCIEQVIGYKFRDPSLLVEAFTHASYPNATTDCYQRLEFLGDAVLDYFIVSYLFHRYPNVLPGGLTEMKDACVSNNTLAALMEKIGLHRHILHFSQKLMHAMEEFVEVIAKLRAEWEAPPTPDNPNKTKEYWFDVSTPKVISDVFEAIIGAVFVDSGFEIDAPLNLFKNLMEPFLTQHIAPYEVIVHPIIQLTRFVHRFGCQTLEVNCYKPTDEDELLALPKDEQVTCTIYIHGQVLAVQKGVVVKAARKYAAQEVLDNLKLNPNLLDPLCNCPSRRNIALSEDEVEDESFD